LARARRGTLQYEPLTIGLQSLLSYVDDFLWARTLTNLADLALHLNALPAGGSPGKALWPPTARLPDGYYRLVYVQRPS
jgi:hypothetical protein